MSIVLDIGKFLQFQGGEAGFLIGLSVGKKSEKVVVGCCTSSTHFSSRDLTLDWREGRDFVSLHYPAGCKVVGAFYKLNEGTDFNQSKLCGDLDEGNALLVIGSDDSLKAYMLSGERELVSLNIKSNVGEYVDDCVTFRLVTQFKSYLPYKGITESVIIDQLQEFISGCVLWLPEQRILLDNKENDRKDLHIFNPTGINKGPVKVELLQKSTPSPGLYPLTVTMTPLTTPTLVFPVTLDVVGVFCNDVDACLVAKQLRDRLLDQVRLVAYTATANKTRDIHSVSLHHYKLPNQEVPITVAYPHLPLSDPSLPSSPLSDSSLLPLRTKLHERFCLPTNRPFLRKMNRQWSPWKQETRLLDPHVALKMDEGGDGVALVTGSYYYYHYMQDRFNDKGWGCAYRSLQTLWSWFRCHGYTDAPVPSHKEIQQALVDCGDKEKSFIGSSEWIGSIEVSTVLNHLLQVESRIHHYTRGADLSGTGRLLQHHFRTQGTPVMIGGGVLAHTILGVDYDGQSGEIKFLILDPHYTGSEDLKLINGKGCGWKRMNFWDQNASYNLCLPICPQEI